MLPPPQAAYPLSDLTRIVVVNRQDCCASLITCYSLQLLASNRAPLYTYPFTTTASSYTFRDSSDAAFASSCTLPPPLPPPDLSSLPTTPQCPAAANQHLRSVRIAWSGTCTVPGDSLLHIAELQVFYNGRNIALGQPTTAKDVLGSSPEFSPSQLVDGKALTVYHAATAGAGSFVSVDLQVGGWCTALLVLA